MLNLPEAILDLVHFKSTYNGLVEVNARFNINNETMENICSITGGPVECRAVQPRGKTPRLGSHSIIFCNNNPEPLFSAVHGHISHLQSAYLDFLSLHLRLSRYPANPG